MPIAAPTDAARRRAAELRLQFCRSPRRYNRDVAAEFFLPKIGRRWHFGLSLTTVNS
jgi:hypothetical protein